ncbi:MAG TPA: nuclear transport factor 2 family protein, partial [Terracidiphilus sp.]|nr:nuclear transport factor 2 family protein [Terracidiphilus sp.]
MASRIAATLILLSAFVLAPLAAHPQAAASDNGLPAGDSLYKTIAALDAKLFDAYNHCDLDTMGSMVADDLEFYHDQTGLMVGKQPFLEAIKNNICGKVH